MGRQNSTKIDIRVFERAHKSFFVEAAGRWPSADAAALSEDSLIVLVQVFTVIELIEDSQVGFLLYLPFNLTLFVINSQRFEQSLYTGLY